MAKLIVTTPAPDFLFWPDAFANDGPADILSTSATVLKFTSNAGYVITLAGAGFIVAGGAATAGTVTSVMVRDAGDSVVFMTIDGLATPLADLYPQLFGSGAGDPLAALELLLKGKDSLVGSSDRDQLGGYSPGNDTVQTYRGNDAVVGDRGNDQLDGGGDFDILSYYLDEGALHGIRLDAEKGVVIDPWGGKDRIENFESYQGTRFADVMKGSIGKQTFYGDDGGDTIDGRGGYDRVIYAYEASEGGAKGISVDFAAGKVKDSFGKTDRIKNIEGIAGTAENDRFVGDAKSNEFLGLAGVDIFKGAGGNDWVAFWLNDSFDGHGVEIDFSRSSGQVRDDGFGNVETLVSIENFFGSDFADRVTGDKRANALEGLAGDDRLSGGGGDDWIDGGDGDDFIQGGFGDDELDGGEGFDTISFESAKVGITVVFKGNHRQETGEGYDRISGFENIIGSAFGDRLTGNNGRNIIHGGAGDDIIDGVWGYDWIDGSAGDDIIVISVLDAELLDGGEGKDTLVFGKYVHLLDLTKSDVTGHFTNFETIDVSTKGNVLLVDHASWMNEGVQRVEGDAGSWVVAVGEMWTPLGTVSDADGTFNRYGFAGQEIQVRTGVGFAVELLAAKLSPSDGFILKGYAQSMSPAGDVNGDGIGDFLLGRPMEQAGEDETRIVFGGSFTFATDEDGRSVFDPSFLSSTQGFVIRGTPPWDDAGWSVSSAGDVNGDGLDDLIIGAPLGDDGGFRAGEAYVVFGNASGFGQNVAGEQVVDLSTLQANAGFVIQGDGYEDGLGFSVSFAGDVNGDGYGDMILGAPDDQYAPSERGQAYVVFGGADGFGIATGGRQVVDLTNLSPDTGFVIRGKTDDRSGYIVSSTGDLNSDGLDDVVVTAPRAANSGLTEVYVLFGSSNAFGAEENGRRIVDVDTIGPTDGFFVRGEGFALIGNEISSAGDVNGDGFDDLLIGSPGYDSEDGFAVGKAYVVYGTAGGFGSLENGRRIVDLGDLSASDGFSIVGVAEDQYLSGMLAGVGDVNGDGFDDMIVGGGEGYSERKVYVIFGSATGLGTIVDGRQILELTHLPLAQGFSVTVPDTVGWLATPAGDLNDDGFDDFAIGGVNTTIIYGGAFGGSSAPVVKTGTGAGESLIGGRGADTLNGAGGVDVFRGGAGNDAIATPDLAFRSIDGGSGTDTLAFTGNGQVIDFTLIADNKVKGIEAFDISGSGADTLVISALDVFHFSDTPNAAFTGATSHNSLVILGDAVDTVSLEGFDPDGGGPSAPYQWQLVASDRKLDGTAGGAYDLYALVRDSAVLASVAIDADIAILL